MTHQLDVDLDAIFDPGTLRNRRLSNRGARSTSVPEVPLPQHTAPAVLDDATRFGHRLAAAVVAVLVAVMAPVAGVAAAFTVAAATGIGQPLEVLELVTGRVGL